MTTAVSAGVIEVKKMVRSRDESYFKDVAKVLKKQIPGFTPDELNPVSLFEIDYDYIKRYGSPDFKKGWDSMLSKNWKEEYEEAEKTGDGYEVRTPFSIKDHAYVSYPEDVKFLSRMKDSSKEMYEEEKDTIHRPDHRREEVKLAWYYYSMFNGWCFPMKRLRNDRVDNWERLRGAESLDFVRGAIACSGYHEMSRYSVSQAISMGDLSFKEKENRHGGMLNLARYWNMGHEARGGLYLIDSKDGTSTGKTTCAVTLMRIDQTLAWFRGIKPVQKFQLVRTLEDYITAVKTLGDAGGSGLFDQTGYTIIFDDIGEYCWSGRKITESFLKALKVAAGYHIVTIGTVGRFSELSPKIQQVVRYLYRTERASVGIDEHRTNWSDYRVDLRDEDWANFDNGDETLIKQRKFGAVLYKVDVDRDGKVSETPLGRQEIRGSRGGLIDYFPVRPFVELREDPVYMYLQGLKAGTLDAILEGGLEGLGNTEEVERKARNDVIRKLVDSGVITQKQLADGVGLHASQISRIVNE